MSIKSNRKIFKKNNVYTFWPTLQIFGSDPTFYHLDQERGRLQRLDIYMYIYTYIYIVFE